MSLGKAVSRRIFDFCREHNQSIDIVLRKANASPTAVAAVIDGRDNDIKMDIMQLRCFNDRGEESPVETGSAKGNGVQNTGWEIKCTHLSQAAKSNLI